MARLLTNTSNKVMVSNGNALRVSGDTRIRIPPTRIYAYITTFDYTNASQTRSLTQVTRSSPQSTSTVTLTADKKYLIVQVSASYGTTVFNYPYMKLEALSL